MRCVGRHTTYVHRCSSSTHRNPPQPGGDLLPDARLADQRMGHPPTVRYFASLRTTCQKAQQSSREGDQQGEWMHAAVPRRKVVSGRDVTG